MSKRTFTLIDSKKKDHSLSSSDDDEIVCEETKFQKLSKNIQEGAHSTKSKPGLVDRTSTKTLRICPYGKNCYRKSPKHLGEFQHDQEDKCVNLLAESTAQPRSEAYSSENIFGFYLTKVHGIPAKFNNKNLAIDIKDILSAQYGKLMQSAQFSYVIDVQWLVQQYPPEFREKPILIVHGEQRGARLALEKSGTDFSNITFCKAELPIPYGTHHTKMMLLLYEKGLRVVITTANLIAGDWFEKSQAMWMSDIFPCLNGQVEKISETNFKGDLIQYLESYKCEPLTFWIDSIKRHDLSSAKVVLVGSVPGRHVGTRKIAFGHLKLRKVLTKFIQDPGQAWPVLGQFSSIGSLGKTENEWLCSELLNSLAASTNTRLPSKSNFHLIYPSVENVRLSLEGYPAGISLPYSYKVEHRQKYLRNFLCQWYAPKTGRSEASPHIKTWMKTDPDFKDLSWFLVTSANLSRAAWGTLEKKDEQLMIRSYELGVLFLPKFFGGEKTFSLNSENKNSFPVPFDLPPKKYSSSDDPWTFDSPHINAPDRHGNKWCPT